MKKNTQPPLSRAVVTKVCKGGAVGDEGRDRHSDCAEAAGRILRAGFLQFVPGCSGVCQARKTPPPRPSPAFCRRRRPCAPRGCGGHPHIPHILHELAAWPPSGEGESLLARLSDFTDSETVWKKQPCVFWDLRRSGLCQAPCRGLARKDRPCGTFAFLSGAGGRPAVCGREDSRQSDPRARRRARLPVPAGGQRTERRPPRRVSPPALPRGCLRLTVTHVTPSRSSALLSWLRRL